MPIAETNGIKMYYDEYGDGEPVFLISGYTADHTSWSHLLPSFSKTYRTIVMDNRGVGQTITPEGPFRIEDMADDVAGLMDALKIDKAHVVGVSMGGRIALALALRHPKKIRGLVLISTTAGASPRSKFALTTMVQEMEKGTMSRELHDRLLLAWTFSEHMFANPEFMKRVSAGASSDRQRPTPADMLRQLEAGNGFDVRDRLKEIHVPSLVIHGEDDILFPVSHGRELAASIPGAEFVGIKGGAHAAYLEMAAQIIPLILSFLAEIDAHKK